MTGLRCLTFEVTHEEAVGSVGRLAFKLTKAIEHQCELRVLFVHGWLRFRSRLHRRPHKRLACAAFDHRLFQPLVPIERVKMCRTVDPEVSVLRDAWLSPGRRRSERHEPARRSWSGSDPGEGCRSGKMYAALRKRSECSLRFSSFVLVSNIDCGGPPSNRERDGCWVADAQNTMSSELSRISAGFRARLIEGEICQVGPLPLMASIWREIIA